MHVHYLCLSLDFLPSCKRLVELTMNIMKNNNYGIAITQYIHNTKTVSCKLLECQLHSSPPLPIIEMAAIQRGR